MSTLPILIVEDEVIVAADLAEKIRQLGYDIAGTTATGEEAIELARRLRPALVIMDIRLAGPMDGIETAAVIHRECKLPIVFLTANSDIGTVERAQQEGILGYILKPFDERDLRIQIEMALYKHGAEQKLRKSEEWLAAVNQILQAALTSATEEALGLTCLDIAEKITRSQFGFIGEIDQGAFQDIAISNPGWGACTFLDPSGHRRRPGNFKIHGLHGRVLSSGKGFFTNDPANHQDSIGLPENHPLLTSFLGVPMMREGSVIGIVAVANREGGYSEAEQEILEALTEWIVEAFGRKRTEAARRRSAEELLDANAKLLDFRRATLNMMQDAVIAREKAEETSVELRREAAERRQAEKALQEEERYLRTILQTTVDGFLVVDTAGKVLEVNNAYCRMSGYTRDELLQLAIAAIDVVEQPAQTAKRIQRIMAHESEVFETLHRRKDGSIFPVELAVTYMNTGSGKLVCFCRDITERKRAEEQILAMNEQLEQRVEQRTVELQETQKQFLHAEKLAAIGKLSASIAHEFNNPLQGILSILKGLKKRAILEEEDRELLDAAIGEGDRIKELIRSLQDFHRPSLGKKAAINVHHSLDSLLILQKSDLNAKRISLMRDYAEELPMIQAVPDQIKQVFLNLLVNAVDACPPSGGKITVSTWQEEERVAVAIKDSGVGIKPEEMEHIFRPFYTTKAAVKGTGLGLSVSYGIVKKHQGEIRVNSQPGAGATFIVLLPIKAHENAIAAIE